MSDGRITGAAEKRAPTCGNCNAWTGMRPLAEPPDGATKEERDAYERERNRLERSGMQSVGRCRLNPESIAKEPWDWCRQHQPSGGAP
jgi:hypothetical protein